MREQREFERESRESYSRIHGICMPKGGYKNFLYSKHHKSLQIEHAQNTSQCFFWWVFADTCSYDQIAGLEKGYPRYHIQHFDDKSIFRFLPVLAWPWVTGLLPILWFWTGYWLHASLLIESNALPKGIRTCAGLKPSLQLFDCKTPLNQWFWHWSSSVLVCSLSCKRLNLNFMTIGNIFWQWMPPIL